MPLFTRFCLIFSFLAAAMPAMAAAPQASAAAAPQAAKQPRETLQIILTTRTITIGANFSGADFYIVGALENSDPQLRRQSRYDVIAALEGPKQTATLYKKERHLGLWVNGASFKFTNVPQFYALASTRELSAIAKPRLYQSLGLGFDYLPIKLKGRISAKTAALYKSELISLKQRQGLYKEEAGSITFGSSRLFSARFRLPDNAPVGAYVVKAYLFRDNVYLDNAATGLEISRENIAYSLYRATEIYAFRYGLAAVLIAVFIGFLGRLIFPK